MKVSIISYQLCSCHNCGLRYPVSYENQYARRCPNCKSEIQLVSNHVVRNSSLDFHPGVRRVNTHIEGLLDNIRSAWNVGSMLRTADGVGIKYMHLCGITSTPDNPKVAKTSLGAESSVQWSHYLNGIEAIEHLKGQGYRLWALEKDNRSISLPESRDYLPGSPIVLVVGNENFGVDPDILAQCEQCIYIPMLGKKHSYNAAVAFGIAAYFFLLNPVSR
jgi:23S rRNA (guanosine2251-2'-O)-methyltransferase